MKYKTPLHLKKLHRENGDTIQVIARTATVTDDGIVEYSYTNTIDTYAMIYASKGFREKWYEIGYEKDVDYVITIDATIPIDRHYLVKLSNNITLDVEEYLPRGSGFAVQYYELLCNRVEG